MNPHIIKRLIKGHKEKVEQELQRQDYMQFLWWGKYGISALIFAIEHCFAKNPRSEYEKEPILSKIQTDGELTEEQKQRELDAFIRQNERMRSNWKRKHKKEEKE